MRQVFVVLGAGASHDCASPRVIVDREMQPPLTFELFDTRFRTILREYPLAQQMVPDLRPAIKSGAIALETFLRDHWRDSEHPDHRRKYWAVPLYLQHLLWETGNKYILEQPDNYDRLINETQRGFDHVTFITLNYDTILDQRLELGNPIQSMDDYIKPGRSWSLIKLHGSVNWGREIDPLLMDESTSTAVYVTAPGVSLGPERTFASNFAALGELGDYLSDSYLFMEGTSLANYRRRSVSVQYGGPIGELVYPALAAPLGPNDTLSCPDQHIDALKAELGRADDGLNLLVIGYSGLDQEVLDLFAASGRPVRAMKFVNGTSGLGHDAAQRFSQGLRMSISEDSCYDGGFSKFAESGEMAAFLRSLK